MTEAPQTQNGSSRSIETELYAAIIHNLAIPIFVKDENSVFVPSNRRHSKLVGLPEKLLGHTTERLHGVDEA